MQFIDSNEIQLYKNRHTDRRAVVSHTKNLKFSDKFQFHKNEWEKMEMDKNRKREREQKMLENREMKKNK